MQVNPELKLVYLYSPMKAIPLMLLLLLSFSMVMCTTDTNNDEPATATIEKTNGTYQIIRDGEPYFIKGVGGSQDMEKLAEMGANSVRTWSTDNAEEVLDKAHELGLTVMMGVWLEHERHGFDYDDEDAVAQQKEEVREKILRYKNHPALLAWGLGNEVDLMYENTRVWHAVEDIAQMVRELDPNNLITTVTAGIDQEKADLIAEKVPTIDFLSVNTYGDLAELPETIQQIGWEKPYAVTEWGPTGHWESPETAWEVPIEETSTEKSEIYRERYQKSIAADEDQSLGSYAFLWGQKQETTPTWYGMFLESGYPTEVVDAMQYLWTGEWPEQRAPSITSFEMNGKTAHDDVFVNSESYHEASVEIENHDAEEITVEWEFLPESTDIGAGGDPEERPETITGLIIDEDETGEVTFEAPEESGPYRLFVYVINEHEKAATANIPFYVE